MEQSILLYKKRGIYLFSYFLEILVNFKKYHWSTNSFDMSMYVVNNLGIENYCDNFHIVIS